MRRNRILLSAALLPAAILFLTAGCSSGPLGGIINVPGKSRDEFRGTVERLDTANRRIEIDQSDGGVRDVYYDNSSVVHYGGERYEPSALERGDQVTVVTRRDGDRYLAETITVTYDASEGNDGPDANDRQTDLLRGEIDRIDTADRRMDVRLSSIDGASSRRTETIFWDSRSDIERDGRDYDVRNLREGDEIEVRARLDGGDYYAETIDLLDQVSDRDDRDGDAIDAVRGTVSRIDTAARRIDLESVSQSLIPSNDRLPSTIYYDSGTVVEYSGRTYEPSSLERGDRIEARGRTASGRFVADRITVTHDSRSR